MSDQIHQRFLGNLHASRKAVDFLANWLRDRGQLVERGLIPEDAQTHGAWRQHVDGGDLFVRHRLEVKWRGFTFSSAEDWPYPHMLVCAKHSWDKANPKPYAYWHLSKDYVTAGIVFGSTSKHWTVEVIADSRYDGLEQDTYVCPLHLVRFIRL